MFSCVFRAAYSCFSRCLYPFRLAGYYFNSLLCQKKYLALSTGLHQFLLFAIHLRLVHASFSDSPLCHISRVAFERLPPSVYFSVGSEGWLLCLKLSTSSPLRAVSYCLSLVLVTFHWLAAHSQMLIFLKALLPFAQALLSLPAALRLFLKFL